MRATDVLSDDHRLIERVVGALSIAAARLDDGEPIPARFFLDAARFIREFADGVHHRKEEDVLFPAMARNGMPAEGGPIAVMLDEHDRGREYAAGLRAAAERFAAGDRAARDAVVDNAQGYAELLRDHIAKEDHILFPMASRVIPPGEHDEVESAFAQLDAAQPESSSRAVYEAIAASLEGQMAKVALL